MPRKYRHIKDDEKKLIEYKTGNRPLFYCQFGCFCTVCTIRGSSTTLQVLFCIMLISTAE